MAAATDGPLTPGEHAGADRIVLVPGAWSSLRPDGRDVVMTHELTHVTVRASTTRSVPVWLSEGFAELVAYQPIRLPEATVVAPALDGFGRPVCRRLCPPTRTSTRAPMRSRRHTASRCWRCAPWRTATGRQAVVRLYRAAAGGLVVPTSRLDDREAAVDDALALDHGHDTVGTRCRQWQARIRRDLLPLSRQA